MNVIPFKAEHLFGVDLQDSQAYLSNWVSHEQAAALEGTAWAYTGVIGNSIAGCAGVLPMWQGRGVAWAYISKIAARQHFISVHKSVSRFLEACYIQRIEMTVDCDFEQGHRWAEMLGFTMEAERMRAYRPDGGDCALYARVL
tara:strand:+ start:6595 stop:7023 length:429 start_codon:yes stop_codon:yes gene_type:complete